MAREVDRREKPSFEATSGDGAPVSLEDLRGDAVLLNVWATWCAPCRQEIPFLLIETEHEGLAIEMLKTRVEALVERIRRPAFGLRQPA